MSKQNEYFKMQNLANDEAEISLFGVIKEGRYWDEDSNTSAKGFKKSLDNLGNVSKIYVNINSYGGSVFEGQAIYSMLKRHSAKIHVRVEGVAASIASVIAMAGDTIEIPKNAQLMIHNPTVGVWGEVKDLEKGIRMLKAATETIAATYHEKTGIPIDELKDLMATETWYSGEEALDKGFATELSDVVDMAAIANIDDELLNTFKRVPKNLLQNQSTEVEPKAEPQAQVIDYELLAAKVAEKMSRAGVPTPKNEEQNNKKPKKNNLFNALKAMN